MATRGRNNYNEKMKNFQNDADEKKYLSNEKRIRK
jgi:hypothetical protein